VALGSWTVRVASPTVLVTVAVVTIHLLQSVAASDSLRTGSYSKTLTFSLSTTTP